MAAHFVHRIIIALMALFGGLEINARDCAIPPSWFFDFGPDAGDQVFNVTDGDEVTLNPSSNFVLENVTYNELRVDVKYGHIHLQTTNVTDDTDVSFAGYNSTGYEDLDTGKGDLYGRFVDISTSETNDIVSLVWKSYGVSIFPTVAYILTAVCRELTNLTDSTPITNQVIIVCDGNRTFAIFNYWTLSDDVDINIENDDFLDGGDPLKDTNNGQPGQWVVELLDDNLVLPTSDCSDTPSWFFDYGVDAGDESIMTDDLQHYNLSRGYVIESTTYNALEMDPTNNLLQIEDSDYNFYGIVLYLAGVDYYTPGGLNGYLYTRIVKLNDPDMTKISAIVSRSYGVTIDPTEAFIMTAVCRRNKEPTDSTQDVPITHQTVTVSDGSRMFAIAGYHSVSADIYIDINGNKFVEGRDPVSESNNCQPGRFVIEALPDFKIRLLEPICMFGNWSDKRCAVCGGCGNRIRKNELSDGSFVRDYAPCPAKKCHYNTHSRREWRRSYRKPWKNIGAARRCCYHWRNPSNAKLLHRPKICEARRVKGFV